MHHSAVLSAGSSIEEMSKTPPPVPSNYIYTSCYCEENIYLLADALTRSVARPDDKDVAWDAYVVFVSNHQKTVALWHQKAREGVVIWDYHVVLVLRPRSLRTNVLRDGETTGSGPWVYDFDSWAPIPCRWREYMSQTFPYAFSDGWELPAQYVSLFRVVPAQGYLDHFVSDRSHMVSGSGAFSVACHENRRTLQLVQGQADVYLAEPPPYPPLRGSKASESQLKTNLMTSFVSMRVHDGDGALPRAADAAETQTYGKVLEMSKFVSWLAGELSSPDK